MNRPNENTITPAMLFIFVALVALFIGFATGTVPIADSDVLPAVLVSLAGLALGVLLIDMGNTRAVLAHMNEVIAMLQTIDFKNNFLDDLVDGADKAIDLVERVLEDESPNG